MMDLEDGELASSGDDMTQDSLPNSLNGQDVTDLPDDTDDYVVLARPKSISLGILSGTTPKPAGRPVLSQSSNKGAIGLPLQHEPLKITAPPSSAYLGDEFYANYGKKSIYQDLDASLNSSDKDSSSSGNESDDDQLLMKKSRMTGAYPQNSSVPASLGSGSTSFSNSFGSMGSSSTMVFDDASGSGNMTQQQDLGLNAFNAHAAMFKKEYQQRKPNLIWSNVVQEEQIADIFDGVKVAEPGALDVEVTRGPETYSFQRPMRQPRERRDSDSSDISSGGLSDNALYYLRDGCSLDEETESSEHSLPKSFTSSTARASNSRKASKRKKSRQKFKKKLIAKLKKMKASDLGKYMAGKLIEEKEQLLIRAVEILGKENCIHIFLKTLKIERRGGVMVKNQKRRRTPGGVFLYLVRGDRRFPKSQIDLIFREDRVTHDKLKKKKQIAKRWKNKAKLEEELGMKVSDDDSDETAVVEPEHDGTDTTGQLGDDSTQESSARDTTAEMHCDGSES